MPTQTIETLTLSEVLDQYDISPVDLLKVDIEGSACPPRTVLKRVRRSDRILSLNHPQQGK